MKKYTEEELISLGYQIENAKIINVDLSMEDHGCLTLNMALDGNGWGTCYGGYGLAKGYVGADESFFKGYEKGTLYLVRIMDTVGVSSFQELKGKYIRVATKGLGSSVKIIGNIISDKWFDSETFFNE